MLISVYTGTQVHHPKVIRSLMAGKLEDNKYFAAIEALA